MRKLLTLMLLLWGLSHGAHAHIPGADPKYFYLHDRLGSVRQILNQNAQVVEWYTCEPFGRLLDEPVDPCAPHDPCNLDNPFRFTGQFYDSQLAQYHLRARQYDPFLFRFTSRDPVRGRQNEPLTLHAQLYCLNNPVNMTDPSGELYYNIARGLIAATSTYATGLTLATIGVERDNSFLFAAGCHIMQLSPLSFAMGMGKLPPVVKITHWGDPSKSPYWAMRGGPTYRNYFKSLKWLPGEGYVPYKDSYTTLVSSGQLITPRGRTAIETFGHWVMDYWQTIP